MKNEKLSVEKVSVIYKKLKNLPVKETSKTKKEAVESFVELFPSLFEKGYTLDDICKILNDNDISISVATLKSYYSKMSQKKDIAPLQVKHKKETFVKKDIPLDEL